MGLFQRRQRKAWQAELAVTLAGLEREGCDLDAGLQRIASAVDRSGEVPDELRFTEIPPVWEAFLRAAARAHDQGHGRAGLRALQQALPLAERLPPQCAHELACITERLAQSSPKLAGLRPGFAEVSQAASRVAARLSGEPAPYSHRGPVPNSAPEPRNPTEVSSAVSDREAVPSSCRQRSNTEPHAAVEK